MATTIPATNVYREKVAAAVAVGGSLPAAEKIAWGTGESSPSPDDTALENEVHRQDLDSVSADDTILTCTGVLQGADSGDNQITEVGVFDAEGDLMGRRVFNPKQLESESSLEFTINFQY
ncbi:MAG: phage tail protein [Desulfosudaceae bacterium]